MTMCAVASSVRACDVHSSIVIPPTESGSLNTTLARRMTEQVRILQCLQGICGGRPPLDLGALERLLVRFSGLVVEQPRIKEIDINPLLASPGQLIALDARVVLHGAEVNADQLPRPAIRPYPTQYVVPWRAPNGVPVVKPPFSESSHCIGVLTPFRSNSSMLSPIPISSP